MNKIKISIKLIILAILLLLLMQLPIFATTGKSTATNVRVRESASLNSEVIELLDENDSVEILGQEGEWYKVNFKGTIGYVSKAFIESQEKDNNNQSKNELNSDKKDNVNQNDDNKNENNAGNSEQSNTNNKNNNPNNNNQYNNSENVPENQNLPIVNKTYKLSDTAKVYILPLITSESINELKKNTEVTLLENVGIWAYVKSNDVNGWITIDNLFSGENKEENKESTRQEETQKQEQAYTPKTMYVKATAINVRSESNTSSNIVECLEINAQVKVIGEENGWYKVEINNKTGYIRQDLLSDKKTEVTSRNNGVDRTIAANNQTKEQQTADEPKQEQVVQSQLAQASSSGVTGTDIANYAKQFVGCKYVYGAAGPNSFDCSGLTMYVYKHFGYNLSHSSKTQAAQGKAVTGELQPGDILVFSNNGKTVGHVGIYIGNDQFVHASDDSTGVIISNLSAKCNKSKYWGARRIL